MNGNTEIIHVKKHRKSCYSYYYYYYYYSYYYSYYYNYYYCYYYYYYYYQNIFLLMPSERSHTYMDMATHHHLDTGPRGQPWWCCPFFAQSNNHIATQNHYPHTSWASYKKTYFSPFVPARYVDTHTYILGPVTPNSQSKHPQVSYSPAVDLGSGIRIFGDV